MNQVPLYDAFSDDYDRFVNWDSRLAFELPFLLRVFAEHQVHRVLDVAGGTGQHAIAFARKGLCAVTTDLSERMVTISQQNAARAEVRVQAFVASFGELGQVLARGAHAVVDCRDIGQARSDGPFDAITCLGNSLPHVVTVPGLQAAAQDFAHLLRPGGVLVVQNRNLERVVAIRERFMSPESHREGGAEWLFWRYYDFMGDPDGSSGKAVAPSAELLRFNLVRLVRVGDQPWQARVDSTLLRAWPSSLLAEMLSQAGFAEVQSFGSYRGERFQAESSGDLILVARRSSPS